MSAGGKDFYEKNCADQEQVKRFEKTIQDLQKGRTPIAGRGSRLGHKNSQPVRDTVLDRQG
jgi:hypothetical protein